MSRLRSIWKVVLEQSTIKDAAGTKTYNKSKSSTHTSTNSWEDSLITIFSFRLASDFWCWFDNSILLSSIKLPNNSNNSGAKKYIESKRSNADLERNSQKCNCTAKVAGLR